MSHGPVDVFVVEFPSGSLETGFIPVLADLIANETIHILDLVVIDKNTDGDVEVIEIEDAEAAAAVLLAELEGEYDGLLSDTDLQLAAEAVSPGSSAVIIAWENIWLARLARSVDESGGVVVEHDHIPAADVDIAFDAIESLTSS